MFLLIFFDETWSKVLWELPTWFPAPRMIPLADPESQSSEKAAACPGFKMAS